MNKLGNWLAVAAFIALQIGIYREAGPVTSFAYTLVCVISIVAWKMNHDENEKIIEKCQKRIDHILQQLDDRSKLDKEHYDLVTRDFKALRDMLDGISKAAKASIERRQQTNSEK